MRNSGSNGVARVLEVVIIKDLLVKDPLGSLYYFNNGSSPILLLPEEPVSTKEEGLIARERGQEIGCPRFCSVGSKGVFVMHLWGSK